MHSFPFFVKLKGRKVLLAGGGEAALAKLRLLLSAGAFVRVVAPVVSEDIKSLIEVGDGEHYGRSFVPEDLIGVDLVFAANQDEIEDRRVADAARNAGKLINAVDRPDLCDFTMPAIVDRGAVVVAISTDGASPVLAQRVRSAIETILSPRLNRLAEFAKKFRGIVAARIASNAERREFWARVIDGRIGQAVLAGDEAGAARDLIRTLNIAGPHSSSGRVWLVGAGPGDPELLTLKAARALREADVIVYDRLVEPSILDYARRDAKRVFVGKSKGDHSASQSEINELLLTHAKAGHNVVRLKGGDPMIFARGGEEIEALSQAGIPYEIVPGITAALGCAAAAGIPLTHRDHSSRLVFLSGHVKAGAKRLDWSGLAAQDQTLVVYMGVGSAATMVDDLVGQGLSPATPVAVVENGTRWNQRIVKGSLGEVEHLLRSHSIQAPAMLVIGTVASFATQRLTRGLAAAAE